MNKQAKVEVQPSFFNTDLKRYLASGLAGAGLGGITGGVLSSMGGEGKDDATRKKDLTRTALISAILGGAAGAGIGGTAWNHMAAQVPDLSKPQKLYGLLRQGTATPGAVLGGGPIANAAVGGAAAGIIPSAIGAGANRLKSNKDNLSALQKIVDDAMQPSPETGVPRLFNKMEGGADRAAIASKINQIVGAPPTGFFGKARDAVMNAVGLNSWNEHFVSPDTYEALQGTLSKIPAGQNIKTVDNSAVNAYDMKYQQDMEALRSQLKGSPNAKDVMDRIDKMERLYEKMKPKPITVEKPLSSFPTEKYYGSADEVLKAMNATRGGLSGLTTGNPNAAAQRSRQNAIRRTLAGAIALPLLNNGIAPAVDRFMNMSRR